MPSIRSILFQESAYTGFEPIPPNCEGWNSDDPFFAIMAQRWQPRLIVEVGTWHGASALHLAKLCPDSEIVCVDTWRGAPEMWCHRPETLLLEHGEPRVYRQFLSNVLHAGKQHQIAPFCADSLTAAEWFAFHGIRPDAVYIDGAHTELACASDIQAWLPLVREGGVLFGDDYGESWPGVMRSVDRLVPNRELAGCKWWTQL